MREGLSTRSQKFIHSDLTNNQVNTLRYALLFCFFRISNPTSRPPPIHKRVPHSVAANAKHMQRKHNRLYTYAYPAGYSAGYAAGYAAGFAASKAASVAEVRANYSDEGDAVCEAEVNTEDVVEEEAEGDAVGEDEGDAVGEAELEAGGDAVYEAEVKVEHEDDGEAEGDDEGVDERDAVGVDEGDAEVTAASYVAGNAARRKGARRKKRRLRCSECSYRCSAPSKMQRHEKRHSVAKNSSCSVCSKAFKHSHSLKNHMRTHGMYVDDCFHSIV